MSHEIRMVLTEPDYNKLVQAYSLVNCLANFLAPNLSCDLQVNPVTLTETLGVIEKLAESIFSAETLKTDGQ